MVLLSLLAQSLTACMLAFSVDWFSHNIPIWIEVFDSIGWLDSTAKLRVLEVPRDSLLLTFSL